VAENQDTQGSTPQPATPAGWFADPKAEADLRYWDGNAWTDHTHNHPPADTPVPASPDLGSVVPVRVPVEVPGQPQERSKRQKWPLLAGLLVLLVLVVVAVTQLSGGGGDSKSADGSSTGSSTPAGSSGKGPSSDGKGSSSDTSGTPGDPGSIRTVDVSLGSPLGAASGDGLLWVTGADGELSAVDTTTRTVVATVQVPPAFESQVAAADGFVAVGNDETGEVTIIDSGSRSVIGSVKTALESQDWRPIDLTIAGGYVWVTSVRYDEETTAPDQVIVIDPVNLEIVARIDVGERPLNPTMIGGRIWVANNTSDSVSIIDPESMMVVGTIAVGGSPKAIAVSNGGVWVTNTADASVSAIDPINLVVVATVPVGTPLASGVDGDLPGPYTIAGGDGLVWLPMIGDKSVVVVDATTFAVVDTLPIGQDFVIDVGLTPGFAWVSDPQADTVMKIDVSTLKVVDEIPVDGRPADPITAGGLVWVPSTGSDTVTVVDPSAG